MGDDPRAIERIASIGRYRAVRKLGEGGMGSVFEVEHVLLQRRLALKLLRPDLAHDVDAAARFFQEARAAAAIGNPHIVDVIDVGVADGVPFLVMELLDGRSLRTMLENDGPMSLARAGDIATQCCRALGAAHAKGIVHRDLKPDNVMVVIGPTGPDFVKIVDFGIAKVLDGATRIEAAPPTQTGATYGTPTYMAPEQLRADRTADARVDVWAVGCLLFEMLSGRPPFVAETYAALAVNVIVDATPSLVELRRDVPLALEQVVHQALEKEPSRRFSSMDALANAIASAISDVSPQQLSRIPSMTVGRKSVDPLAHTTPVPQASRVLSPAADTPIVATRSAVTPATRRAPSAERVERRLGWPLWLAGAGLVLLGGVGALGANAWLTASRPQPTASVIRSRLAAPAHDAAAPTVSTTATTSGATPGVTPGSSLGPSSRRLDAGNANAIVTDGVRPVTPVTSSVGRVASSDGRRRPDGHDRGSSSTHPRSPAPRPIAVTPAAPSAPEARRVRVRNGRQIAVTVTLSCGSASRSVVVAAGSSTSIEVPAAVCRVSCRASGAIPLCPPRLAAGDQNLSIE